MTDQQRQAIKEYSYRLRGRLTFAMLCSHTLQLDLQNVLSKEQETEFRQMDRVLEETKALLQTLLERFDVLSHDNPVSDRDDSQLIGVPCNSKDPAWAEIPETCRDDKLHRKLILP